MKLCIICGSDAHYETETSLVRCSSRKCPAYTKWLSYEKWEELNAYKVKKSGAIKKQTTQCGAIKELYGYKFEKTWEFEIRIEAPDGASWSIRSEVGNEYGFQKFLWDMVKTILDNSEDAQCPI